MSDEIPQWAIEKAMAGANALGGAYQGSKWTYSEIIDDGRGPLRYQQVVRDFARYIMQHEEPPVDRDVLAVREVIASQYADPTAMGYIKGYFDKAPSFLDALAAYRKHKQ